MTLAIVTTAAVGVRAQTAGSAGISSSVDHSLAELFGDSGRRFPGAATSPSGGFTVLQSHQQGTRVLASPIPCHIHPHECEVISHCGFGLCFLLWILILDTGNRGDHRSREAESIPGREEVGAGRPRAGAV